MQFSCLQENLNYALGVVGRTTARKPVMPITQNILVEAKAGRIRLASTDLELSTTTWITAMIEEEGVYTVPGKLLADFVGTIAADRVDVGVDEGGSMMLIQSGRSKASINGMQAEDFPPVQWQDDGASFVADAQTLRRAFNRVSFAAAREESRPVLTGVQFKIERDRLILAAADGFRLAVDSVPITDRDGEIGPDGDVTCIVPHRALSEVSRLVGDVKGTVKVAQVTRGQLRFTVETDRATTELTSVLVQGAFPNYSQLIPQKWESRAVFDPNVMAQSVKTTAIFARESQSIRLSAERDEEQDVPVRMVVSAQSESSGDSESVLPLVDLEGPPLKIAFNNKFFADVLDLRVLGSCKRIALEGTTSSSPGVIRPVVEENEEPDDYVCVVMPMFVAW